MRRACSLDEKTTDGQPKVLELTFEHPELREAYDLHVNRGVVTAESFEGRPSKRSRLYDAGPVKSRNPGMSHFLQELSRLLSVQLPQDFGTLIQKAP